MGGACHTCEKAGRAERTESNPEPSSRKNTKNASITTVQSRANLQIKAGGFSLGKFAATNAGKIEDLYEVETDSIGEGAYGVVRIGKSKRLESRYAIKSISKATPGLELEKLQEEIEIMRLLDHPNIVRLIETFEDNNCVYLVMDLCVGGELFDKIVNLKLFSEKIAANCVQQMLLAVNYIHQNCIMHRDLKPENWLLAEKGSMNSANLKLIDFGASKRFVPGQFCTTRIGTATYMAPEVQAGRYDERSDVFSVGCILYVMLSGGPPFSGETVEDELLAVRTTDAKMDVGPWLKISAEAKEIARALMVKEPTKRPSALQALDNAWISAPAKAARTKGKKTSGTRQKSLITDADLVKLRKFGNMNQIKKACYNLLVAQLPDSKVKKMKAVFMELDYDRSGSISVEEIRGALEQGGCQVPDDLDELIASIDTDGSGVLDYTEFLAATLDRRYCQEEEVVRAIFQKLDADGSGFLEREELAKYFNGETDNFFESMDTDGNGMIDFKEFYEMMRSE
eukprot:TRINITY_DN3269_c0_g3_i1.p1 TRINITY_DN3269_c0_g3~~TRINITY_DN3269_c0_g3_i1.p1  ORF type:complete len:535 (-),score=126.12 TRINITY_DN3269_c0_g3_i1:115-1650(-)